MGSEGLSRNISRNIQVHVAWVKQELTSSAPSLIIVTASPLGWVCKKYQRLTIIFYTTFFLVRNRESRHCAAGRDCFSPRFHLSWVGCCRSKVGVCIARELCMYVAAFMVRGTEKGKGMNLGIWNGFGI